MEQALVADFYVPAGSVYIDCWDDNLSASEISARLAKREVYRDLSLRHLEINTGDEERLDEVLGRGLLGFGVRA